MGSKFTNFGEDWSKDWHKATSRIIKINTRGIHTLNNIWPWDQVLDIVIDREVKGWRGEGGERIDWLEIQKMFSFYNVKN